MQTKKVYQSDVSGVYVGEVVLDESDLCPVTKKDWMIPSGCVEQKPPKKKKGFDRVWDGSSWNYVEIPKKVEEVVEEVVEEGPSKSNAELRREAYLDADSIKNEIEFDAIINGVDPDYTPWVEFVKSIKEQYPIEEENTSEV